MTDYIFDKNDIGLMRSDDTTTVGLMLAQDERGIPIYRTYQEKYLVPQVYSGVPDYGALDPETELRRVVDDWRSGFGQEIYDSQDPKRYYYSKGCDLRHKGKAILSYGATAITGTGEGWMHPTSFTASSWVSEGHALDGNTGTYATSAGVSGDDSWSAYLEATVTSLIIDSVRYYVTDIGADFDVMEIDAYYGASYENVYTGAIVSGSYVQKDMVSAEDVTKVRVRFQRSSVSPSNPQNLNFNELQLKATTPVSSIGIVADWAEFNDQLYIAGGTKILRYDDTNVGFNIVRDFGVTPTELETFTDGKLYIGFGTAGSYFEMNTNEYCISNTLTVNKMRYLKTVHLSVPTMFGNDTGNAIRSTTNPAAGGTQWTGQTIVGSSDHDILQLFSKDDTLYIKKEDKPYYLVSGEVKADLAPATTSLTTSTSGGGVDVGVDDNIYYPVGAQSLLRIGSTNSWITPGAYSTGLADFAGKVFGCTHDDQWEFAVTDNVSNVEIIAGREETVNGSTGWVWHPLQEIVLSGVKSIHSTSVGKKSLWIAPDNTSQPIYRLPLPTKYGDLTTDDNRNFASTGYFVTPYHHMGFKGDTKAFIKITATLGHAHDTGIYWECHYQKLEDSTWTDAGDMIGTDTNRVATLYIPVDGSSVKPISTMIRFKFVGITNDTTKTPELLSYDIHALLYPTIRDIIDCEVVAGDEVLDKDGVKIDGLGAAEVRTVLEEFQDNTWPQTFYDVWGVAHTVKLMPVKPFSVISRDLEGENLEEHFFLKMQKVTLS